jgi:hypothetical protein
MTEAVLPTFSAMSASEAETFDFRQIAQPGMRVVTVITGCGGGGGGGGGGGQAGGGGGGGGGAMSRSVVRTLDVAQGEVFWEYKLEAGSGGHGHGMANTPDGQNGQSGDAGEVSSLACRLTNDAAGEWKTILEFAPGRGGGGGHQLDVGVDGPTGGAPGEGADGVGKGGLGGEKVDNNGGPGRHGAKGENTGVAKGGAGGQSEGLTGIYGGGGGGGGGAGMDAGGNGAGPNDQKPTVGKSGGGGGGGHGWNNNVANDVGAKGGDGQIVLQVVKVVRAGH